MGLTEEERKEKQRQILARYGLGSEDEEEQDSQQERSVKAEPETAHVKIEEKPVVPTVTKVVAEYMPVSPWPGVTYPMQDVIEYDSAAHTEDSRNRNVKNSLVTRVAAVGEEGIERRIAANSRIVTYSVKSLIRVVGIEASNRCLLKGHGGSVSDLELLAGTGGSDHILGSIAKDGSVYLWWIHERTLEGSDLDDDLELSARAQKSFKHPKDKACYQKICFNNSFSEGIEVALFDRESTNIRYLCCGSRICSADGEVGNFDDITLNGDQQIEDIWWHGPKTLASALSNGTIELWDVAQGSKLTAKLAAEKPVQTAPFLVRKLGPHSTVAAVEKSSSGLRLLSVEEEVRVCQTIQMKDGSPENSTSFIETDPSGEILALGKTFYKSIFVMHYNSAWKKIDAITQLNIMSPILSFAVTRVSQTKFVSGNQVGTDDLILWCVHPEKVQRYYVSARDCAPAAAELETNGGADAAAETVEKAVIQPPVSSTQEEKPDPTPASGLVEPVSEKLEPVEPNEKDEEQVKEVTEGAAQAENGEANVVDEVTVPEPVANTITVEDSGTAQKPEEAGEQDNAASATVSMTSELEALMRETMKLTMAGLYRTVAEKLNSEKSRREKAEKDRQERLLKAVSGTMRGIIDNFVEEAVQQHLKSALVLPLEASTIPDAAATETLTKDLEKSLQTHLSKGLSSGFEDAVSSKSLQTNFADLLVESKLGTSFRDASSVMSRQVADAIGNGLADGISDKLVASLREMRMISTDAVNTVNELQATIQAATLDAAKVDGRTATRSFVAEIDAALSGDLEGVALITAMEAPSLSLLTNLVQRISSRRSKALEELRQGDLLRLTSKLTDIVYSSAINQPQSSSSLEQGDVDVNEILDWLSDTILLIEPEADEIKDNAKSVLTDTLSQLQAVKDSFDTAEDAAKANTVKLLVRVVRSLV
uniref:Enhancer of mRNA-decapping protein 4 WD40 repeat region domain-containing protein n=1 Tax=Rhodosorus marinus TaxID=101924 RepID=A0A7S2ZUL2_9RHOD|mmetsp:Transcript_31659/g.122592  ORF Transcript_31659/g.122592 Transcript_31659/m.122592 type:complete len:936 (-) Transcript_31659:226-3033(-)|eukprot:CAMPEP_0113961694 /NCGR_PEP_ID=MMETSP0011_2-20120614/5468_1 /TAXON_ID=101924 /ORGANISM="Rhodosorus marinus" /LENGTH=935 /DNA_ID=CAMNT_0000973397 /DNA_START=106 /DNA_END=2913 /DNA_ORIENTATION=+ /assembly_acc=CAM_ASM_000156